MGVSNQHRPSVRLFPVMGAGLLALVVLAACAPAAQPAQRGEPSSPSAPRSSGPKTINIAITGNVEAMGVMGAPTTSGGWHSLTETYAAGLITSDVNSRNVVGRLAVKAPSVDDGSISMLPDGRMKVVFPLRRDVTWQDGTPFTAQDLMFSYRFNADPGLPTNQLEHVGYMHSVEAPDDFTFVVYYKNPFYQGAALGVRQFWPHPRHILGESYEHYLVSKNADEVANLPYWTSAFLHLGPFRLTSFEPGEGIALQAYDGYSLGRPKIDSIRVRVFGDENTVFSNVLAEAIDIVPDTALSTDLGFQLKDRWDRDGGGTVYVRPGSTRFLQPQYRQGVQIEPALFDPRVKGALYQAIDRDVLGDPTQGNREQPAWSLLPPGDRLYEPVKDGLRRYPFDPERSKAILRDVGWSLGTDGALRSNADGHRFHTAITTTPRREWEATVYADYWRRIGLEVDELDTPAAKVRDREYRALFPGFEASSSGQGDSVLGRMEGPAASAANRWVGERGGYEDPRAQTLIDRYRASLSDADQAQSIKALSDFVVAELPILIMYYSADHVAARKNVKAFDDVLGGSQSSNYGTYTRNSHLWDLQ